MSASPIASPYVWYDASKNNDADLASLASLADRSGNSRTAASTVGSNDPFLRARHSSTKLNGYGFTGLRGLEIASATGIGQNVPGLTFAAAFAHSTASINQVLFWVSETSVSDRRAVLRILDVDGQPTMRIEGRRQNADPLAFYTAPEPIATGRTVTVVGVLDYANANFRLFVDRSKVTGVEAGGPLTAGNSENIASGTVAVAGRSTAETTQLLGTFYEGGAYQRAVSDSEAVTLLHYLADKWAPSLGFDTTSRFVTTAVTPKSVIGSWLVNGVHVSPTSLTIDIKDSAFNSVIGGPQSMTADTTDTRLVKYEHASNIFSRGNQYFLIFGGTYNAVALDETIHPIRF